MQHQRSEFWTGLLRTRRKSSALAAALGTLTAGELKRVPCPRLVHGDGENGFSQPHLQQRPPEIAVDPDETEDAFQIEHALFAVLLAHVAAHMGEFDLLPLDCIQQQTGGHLRPGIGRWCGRVDQDVFHFVRWARSTAPF